MAKLTVIDPVEYILDGDFEKIRAPGRTIVDVENVLTAIEQYRIDYVEPGLAVGELNDGFLIIPTEDGEQVVEEERDPAFMIIDIYWDSESRAICGTIIILDTEDGDKIKKAIDQGIECFMSASQTDSYETMDNATGRTLYRISNIKGYKISLFDFHNKT